MKENDRAITEKQLAAIRAIIAQPNARGAQLVLATYSREEFVELRPGDDYDAFKRQERIVTKALVREGLAGRVVFQEVDSVGYYEFIGKRGLPNCDSSRAAYAAAKWNPAQRGS